MNTKILSIYFAILAVFSSCQSDYFEFQSDRNQIESRTLSRSNKFKFPDGWQYLETNEVRWAALQIPDSLLPIMSTEELVEACMEYPLAPDCFAYNDVQHGLSDVISRFNGFAELKKREDAFDKVLDFYSRKLEEIITFGNNIGYSFSSLEFAFYERFIISGYLVQVDELSKCERLRELYSKSCDLHDSYDKLHGSISTQTISAMRAALGDKKLSRNHGYFDQRTIYLTTSGGLKVEAFKIDCQDPDRDIAEGRKYIKDYFPTAIILNEGTCTYNCHGYAWWMSEGGEECWINNTLGDESENLAKFFRDGIYSRTSSPSPGDKVYYTYGDHSAIVYSGNVFTSKWGPYPLVRHKSTECPYNSIELIYYKENQFKTGKVYWDMNPDPTPINTYEDFSISDYYDPSVYRTEIFISGGKEPDEPLEDDSKAYIISKTNNTARVFFAARGIYYVNFSIYLKTNNRHMAKYVSDEVYVAY
ncbi:MAG: hypothetical protein K2K27_07335 [Muribaculaceae bacterium]|nr:hypothetical protein [Muribaculaceae bacterium]